MRSISSSRAVTITIGSRELLADRPAEVEAVGVGELEVEDREADVVLLERQQPFDAARRPDDAEAVASRDRCERASRCPPRPRRAGSCRPAPVRRRSRPRALEHVDDRGRPVGRVRDGDAALPAAPAAARAGAPRKRKRVPASSATVTGCRRRAMRSVIACLESAVTMPRSVTTAGVPNAADHEGAGLRVVHDAGDEPGTNVGERGRAPLSRTTRAAARPRR